MADTRIYHCSICGTQKGVAGNWFLLSPDGSEENLRVLKWDDALATRPGMHAVCGTIHAQQLISQWMMAGSLPSRHETHHDGSHVLERMPEKDLYLNSDSMQSLLRKDSEELSLLIDAIEVLLAEELAAAQANGEQIMFDA